MSTPPTHPDQLFTVLQAAALLALKPSTVRKLISRRQIAICRPTTRAVRIPQAELARIQREGLQPRREEGRW